MEEEETTEEIDDTEDEDLEEEDLEYEVSDEEEEADEEESEEEDEEEKESIDDKLKDLTEIGDKIKSATTHYDQLSKAIKEAQSSLHNIRQEKKAAKTGGDEAVFTDAQLQAILEEHPNEPGVQLQVLKQMIKQGLGGVEENAAKRAEQSARKGELDGYLTENWPELKQEGSEIWLAVNETRNQLNIENHPHGDFLATGAHVLMNIPEMIEKAKEEGRAEALKTKVETNRKEKIKSNKLPGSGKNKASGKITLSSDHKTTAKQIGLNSRQEKIYAQLLQKGRTINAEV